MLPRNSNRIRIKLRRVMYMTIGWALFGVLNSVYDHLVGMTQAMQFTEMYNFELFTAINILGGVLGGLLGGSFMIFYLKDRLRQTSFGVFIIANTLIILGMVVVITIIVSVIFNSVLLSKPLTHPEVIREAGLFLSSNAFYKNIYAWFMIVAFTNFFLQVNDKYGPGVFRAFIMGKYHRPKQETRIFMFLDIKSSTTIAEEIGDKKYFQFLNEFYSDVSDPIVYSLGEIYQYVGDEVVVSWQMNNGIRSANCINCYFDILKTINNKSEIYISKYGYAPAFRAGFHYGQVTTGEIGIIKKDIVFTGDVLNTASRILELSKVYEQDIMLSKDLVNLMDLTGKYDILELGQIELRGKTDLIQLCTVSPTGKEIENKSKAKNTNLSVD